MRMSILGRGGRSGDLPLIFEMGGDLGSDLWADEWTEVLRGRLCDPLDRSEKF